jgi:hypothetical protein
VDTQQKSFDIPWPAVLTVAALLAGYFTYRSLQTSRPAERTGYLFPKTDLQDVNARLWQDPLRAAYEHAADTSPQGCKNQSLHAIAALRSSRPSSGSWQILGVMIPGGSYAEYNEIRLRARHAVIDACGRQGYSPKSGEYIGYTLFDLGDATQEIVPFEWWEANGGGDDKSSADKKKDLLLLWLREDAFQNAFQNDPFTTLNQLFWELTFDIDTPSIAIIGPRSSTTLLAMLSRAQKQTTGLPYLKGVRFFCPTATASTKELGIANGGQQDDSVKERLGHAGVTFERFTTTDDQLCRELARELQRRGVKLDPEHIALISEFDTFYGRALPDSFIDEAQRLTGKPQNWLTYRYLRGIDGQLPQQPIDETRKKQRDKKTTLPNEPTEGLNQADYLTRLAHQLANNDEQLRKKTLKGIEAVGVLGTDVYDKLMILRALSKTLPGALFFTTNLDARFGHPDEWQEARNLIVASPFGFSLRQDLQSVPPFRDSYQTATYAASLAALGEPEVSSDKLGEPRIFEIGRDGPFDLSPDRPANHPTSIQPPNANLVGWFPGFRILVAIVIAVLSMFTAYWVAQRIGPTAQQDRPGKQQNRDLPSWEQLGWSSSIVLPVAFFLCWLVIYLLAFVQRAEGEPFAWFQGISIWPTEIFRLFVGVMAIFFFLKTERDLKNNDKILGQTFGLDPGHSSPNPEPNFWKRLFCDREFRKKVFRDKVAVRDWKVHVNDDDTGPIDSVKLWRRYVEAGIFRFRLLRFLPLALAYVAAGTALIAILGLPPVPYRGSFSWACDLLFLVFAVALSIFLTFYVVDATMLNRRLIHYLVKATTEWPDAAYEKLRERKLWSYPHEQLQLISGAEHPPGELLEDYLDIDLIARRTKVVGNLIYYPFILISILIVSRNALFDNWTWPFQLLIVIGGTAAYALWSAVRLRRTAEMARRRALESLNDRLIYKVAEGKGDSPEAQTAREMMTMIKEEDRGAFAPILQHPVFRALLLPSGGAGIWALTQYLPFS